MGLSGLSSCQYTYRLPILLREERGGVGIYSDSVLVGGREESCLPLWVLEEAGSHCSAQWAVGSSTQLMCLEPSLFLVLQLPLWKF